MGYHGHEDTMRDRYSCNCSMHTFLTNEEIRLVERHRKRKRLEATKRRRANEPERKRLMAQREQLDKRIAELEK